MNMIDGEGLSLVCLGMIDAIPAVATGLFGFL